MVNALKKLDKKFLITAGLLIFIPILVIIFLALIQGCSNKTTSYESYEKKMLTAGEKYLKSKLPTTEAEVKSVSLDTLVKEKYVKSADKALKDNSCKGEVTVRLNGSLIEENKGGYYNYTVNLDCKNYKTNTLKKLIEDNVVSEGAGLYKVGNSYMFKGDEVKNYLTLSGKSYRILGIDSNGIVKLLSSETLSYSLPWDTKYNSSINDSKGITKYQDSSILKYLNTMYNNEKLYKASSKKHMIAYDVCIDSRNEDDYTIKNYDECLTYAKKQIISLPSVNDFALASSDKECTNLNARSCINYNYLRYVGFNTWTLNPVATNSYEVFYVSSGFLRVSEASEERNAFYVIYIDGNELVKTGNGSKDHPYVID